MKETEMMKAWRIGLAPATLLLAGCGLLTGEGNLIRGSGEIVSEARDVSGFEAVALLGSGEVIITQGESEGLVIEADDNLLPLITSEVRGGTLELGFDRANWADVIQPSTPILYMVAVRDLNALDLAGSGRIEAASLSAESLRLTISGSGDIALEQVSASELNAALPGSGNMLLTGEAERQVVSLAGSGTYEAGDLESQSAEVTLSGSGNVTVWVREALDVRLSGSGTVNYFGTPAVGQRDISGSGDINPMGEK
jgi:hypothetical protein